MLIWAPPPAIEAELLSGARLWASKNRPDVARQLIDKLLVMDPYSPQGLGALGDLALRVERTSGDRLWRRRGPDPADI